MSDLDLYSGRRAYFARLRRFAFLRPNAGLRALLRILFSKNGMSIMQIRMFGTFFVRSICRIKNPMSSRRSSHKPPSIIGISMFGFPSKKADKNGFPDFMG
jgi:hypothetical protein